MHVLNTNAGFSTVAAVQQVSTSKRGLYMEGYFGSKPFPISASVKFSQFWFQYKSETELENWKRKNEPITLITSRTTIYLFSGRGRDILSGVQLSLIFKAFKQTISS